MNPFTEKDGQYRCFIREIGISRNISILGFQLIAAVTQQAALVAGKESKS
jgi:hypothetical protein